MFSLTIVFGPAATAWTLMFKTEEKAGEAYGAYIEAKLAATPGPLIGSDDFGQAYALPIDQIHGMMLEDMSLSSEARIERGLDQARAQAKAQERMMADPTLMAAARRQHQGPAVLGPNGMPRMM